MDVVIFSPLNSSSKVRLLLLVVLLLVQEKDLVGVQVSLLFAEVSFSALVGDDGKSDLMVALLILVGGMVSHRKNLSCFVRWSCYYLF